MCTTLNPRDNEINVFIPTAVILPIRVCPFRCAGKPGEEWTPSNTRGLAAVGRKGQFRWQLCRTGIAIIQIIFIGVYKGTNETSYNLEVAIYVMLLADVIQ